MKVLLKLVTGILCVFLLTGCIGESYIYTPPNAKISNSSLEEVKLEKANIDWNSDKHYTNKVEDIFKLAKEQEQLRYKPGERAVLEFDSGDFLLKEITVTVWKDDKKSTQLEMDKDSGEFHAPTEKGNYIIDINIDTDSGTAQYVGNILVD